MPSISTIVSGLLFLSVASAVPTARGSCSNGPNFQNTPALMTTVNGVKLQGGTPLSPLLFFIENIKGKAETYTVKNSFGTGQHVQGLTLSGDGKSVSFADISANPSSSQSWVLECAECNGSKPVASNCKVRTDFKGKQMCLAATQTPGNAQNNLVVSECSSSAPLQFFDFTRQ